jgi:hypothetical protein
VLSFTTGHFTLGARHPHCHSTAACLTALHNTQKPFTLPGIATRLLGRPAHSRVTILTELSPGSVVNASYYSNDGLYLLCTSVCRTWTALPWQDQTVSCCWTRVTWHIAALTEQMRHTTDVQQIKTQTSTSISCQIADVNSNMRTADVSNKQTAGNTVNIACLCLYLYNAIAVTTEHKDRSYVRAYNLDRV